MNLKDYLSRERGRNSRMAEHLNVSRGFVSMMSNNKKSVPPKIATAIESFTNGEVSRRDLISNWKEIWPELESRYDDK